MSPQPIMTVSGIRGIVDESFTEELCALMAYAQTKSCSGGKMVIARDTRPSGERFARACSKGIHAAGATAIDIGIAPTPTACVAVAHLGAQGGIILSASHNPIQYNGYKMVHKAGRLARGSECEAVYKSYREYASSLGSQWASWTTGTVSSFDASDVHIHRILAAVNIDLIRAAHLSVAIDSINGAAAAVFPKLLEKLGVQWSGCNTGLDGNFTHNPEPRPEHLVELSNHMKTTPGLCGGFVFDPDADRLMTMGEHGEPVSEELTLALSMQSVLPHDVTDVATNLSTSMVIDDVARSHGVKVIRAKIGEANVVEAMERTGCRLGGEGNGGVIYPKISTVRDGLAGMALILELMATSGKTITQLIGPLPVYPIIKKTIPAGPLSPTIIINRLTETFKNETIDTQDGLKIIRSDGWVHVRPSNTEPILRCYAEATSEAKAQELVAMVMDALAV